MSTDSTLAPVAEIGRIDTTPNDAPSPYLDWEEVGQILSVHKTLEAQPGEPRRQPYDPARQRPVLESEIGQRGLGPGGRRFRWSYSYSEGMRALERHYY